MKHSGTIWASRAAVTRRGTREPRALARADLEPSREPRALARADHRTRHSRRRRGFTLAEMVVVIGVILILATVLLPAVRTVWAQRKVADAENIIRGLLMTARPRALEVGGSESGLFFMVDQEGVQRIYPIVQQPLGGLVAQHQFVITGERDYALPVPMRVVPRYAVELDEPGEPADDPYTFSFAELDNNFFPAVASEFNEAQRHRNYFTMIYSNAGHLQVWSDVLIRDEDANENGRGDRTGLDVSEQVTQYHPQTGEPLDIDPTGGHQPLYDLVTDDSGVALNFPSVDGLLVYDDALFNQMGDPLSKRDYLLRAAQPFYVSRLSGAVVKGPVGENE